MSELDLPSITEVKAVVDLLADMEIDPLHLHVDGRRPMDSRPRITLWMRHRTDFMAVCDRIRVKPQERIARTPGQREWFAEADTLARQLLIQCVSLVHHDDWEPREVPA